MSDPGHDPQPDRAALDELARAFGLGADADAVAPAPVATPGRRADDPTRDQTPDDPTGFLIDDDPSPVAPVVVPAAEQPPTELVDLVRDDAPVEPPEPTPEALTQPAPARIIRIDDITGNVGTGEQVTLPAGPPAGPPSDGTGTGSGERPSVIAIDADDLPDAVYVAGSLDSDASRSIVFIEDDAASEVLQPESDRDLRRGIEPRLRERRVQVRRAQSRKRLKWVVLAFVLLLVGIGGLAVFGSTLFAVREDQLRVVGAVYADPDRLAQIEDELIGTPTLRVDTQRIERELEAIPWVDEAKVTVRFPYSATIEIREREAMVTYQGPDGRYRVLDREGRVLDVLEKWPIAYVLVTGPDPVDLEPGQSAPRGYVGAAELAKNLTGSVRGQVEHIEVTADGQRLTMLLQDGTEVRFGDYRNLFTKLVRLETRLADPEREPGPIDVATG